MADTEWIRGATPASPYGLAAHERSGVSRPARELLNVNGRTMRQHKRFGIEATRFRTAAAGLAFTLGRLANPGKSRFE